MNDEVSLISRLIIQAQSKLLGNVWPGINHKLFSTFYVFFAIFHSQNVFMAICNAQINWIIVERRLRSDWREGKKHQQSENEKQTCNGQERK